MRHTSSNRRGRKRGGGRRSGQGRTQVYDSNGPDVRIRGTAHQVAEKYEALAKDARAVGNMIMAESYMQHAEHYLRIISSLAPKPSVVHEDESANVSGMKNGAGAESPEVGAKSEDDLSLPSSILGDEVYVPPKEVAAV